MRFFWQTKRLMMGENSPLKYLAMVEDQQEIMVDGYRWGRGEEQPWPLAAFSAPSLLVGSWDRPSPARPADIGIGGEGERNPLPIHPSILLGAAISDDWGAYRSLIGQSVSGAWCEKTGGAGRAREGRKEGYVSRTKAREVNIGSKKSL